MEPSIGVYDHKPIFNLLSRTSLIWGGTISLVHGFGIPANRGIINRYWADDRCHYWNFKDRGLIGTLEGCYNILLYAFNRFSPTFFSWVVYNLGIFRVKILPALVIVLWVGGTYQLSGNLVRLFQARVGKAERCYLSSLLPYATLFMAPNQVQILYRRAAVMPYTFPPLSLIFLLSVITRHMLKPYRRLWIGLFAGLMSFIAVGFSEIGGTYIMGVLVILLALVLIFKKRLPPSFQWAVFPLSIALGLVAKLVLALCPSNELRRVYSYFEPIPLVRLPGLVLFLGLAAYAARTYTHPINTIPFFEKRAHVWDERDATIRLALTEGRRDGDVRDIDNNAGVLELHPQPNWVNRCAAEVYCLDEKRSTIPWD